MTRLLLAGAAALGLMSGATMAQTSTSTTTTTVTPSVPVTVQTMKTNASATEADGDKTVSAGVGSRDSVGNENKTTVTNKTYPLTNLITSVKKEQHTVNGVTTETVTTTETYPHIVGRPDVAPVVTKSTHVVADAK
jgi:hypothetical protein